jgi:hypothetical protein
MWTALRADHRLELQQTNIQRHPCVNGLVEVLIVDIAYVICSHFFRLVVVTEKKPPCPSLRSVLLVALVAYWLANKNTL